MQSLQEPFDVISNPQLDANAREADVPRVSELRSRATACPATGAAANPSSLQR
jgi:hypothetical protein